MNPLQSRQEHPWHATSYHNPESVIEGSAARRMLALKERLAQESDPVERSVLRGSLKRFLVSSEPGQIPEGDLPGLLELVPSDSITRVISSILSGAPERLGEIMKYYWSEQDIVGRQRAQQGLLAYISHSNPITKCNIWRECPPLREALTIFQGPSQEIATRGNKIFTDFYVVSQLLLAPLGNVRFLPLPERMPKLRPWGAQIPEDAQEEVSRFMSALNLVPEGRFGRSLQFSSRYPTRPELNQMDPKVVLKAEREAHGALPGSHRGSKVTPEDAQTSLLRYETEIMAYLARNRDVFGLRSFIPSPARGPNNAHPVWKIDGVHYCKYGSPDAYLTYIDDIADFNKFQEALTLNVEDFSRLARFGIFHTAIAAPFHNTEQGRRFLWDNGGVLNGAGRLDRWTQAFRFSNMRESGVADFEHIDRYQGIPAISKVVADGIPPHELGLQHHLGEILFSALHVTALWFRKHRDPAQWQPDLNKSLETVFRSAHLGFCGQPWPTFDQDIDIQAIGDEVKRFMSVVRGDKEFFSHDGEIPDLGRFGGEYPMAELLKGVTAFTIRATHDFVDNRNLLKRASREVIDNTEAEAPRFSFSDYVGPNPKAHEENRRFMDEKLIQPLIESPFLGKLSREQAVEIANQLRGRDVLWAKVKEVNGSERAVTLFRARAVDSVLRAKKQGAVQGVPHNMIKRQSTWLCGSEFVSLDEQTVPY